MKPGPLTLFYPQWIPGEHGPTGPIADLAGMRITAGQTNPVEARFRQHVRLPSRRPARRQPARRRARFHLTCRYRRLLRPEAPPPRELAVLNWNQFLLYPAGTPTDQLNYQASLKVPAGWRYGTALPIANETGDIIQFKPSSLTTLIDSPVSTGAHFRTIDLNPGGSPRALPAHRGR